MWGQHRQRKAWTDADSVSTCFGRHAGVIKIDQKYPHACMPGMDCQRHMRQESVDLRPSICGNHKHIYVKIRGR